MTGREKMEREEFYKTVILSLEELPSHELTINGARTKEILLELLPMYAEAGSREEKAVRNLLLSGTPAKETEKLYEAVSENWDKGIQVLGWHCLEWLSPIWTEELLES